MIIFRKRTWWESLLRLIPSYRKKQDQELAEVIRELVKDPSLPCQIEGTIIPDGYGNKNHNEQRFT